jgi:DNA-binding transcriptional LysR family regulator
MIDDIRYLIVFAKVAEAGTFSAGAEALGLTTATASAHVSRLERNLGTALLYRNTRRLSLTRDGEAVLETARGMLSLYQSGVVAFKSAPAGAREALHVAIPAALMDGPFMAALATFVVAHPDLDISLRCRDSREDIVGESIDLAFRIGELADSSLKARKVFDPAGRSWASSASGRIVRTALDWSFDAPQRSKLRERNGRALRNSLSPDR